MPYRLHENEAAVEHQGDYAVENKLRAAKYRTRDARRDVGQNERKRREGSEHGQSGARPLELKSLFAMAGAAPQQARADNAITNDHHRGKNRVACEVRLFHRSCDDHGDDQRDLNDGDGDGQNNRAEWFADPMRDHFGMVDGCENGGDERYSCGCGKHPASASTECR